MVQRSDDLLRVDGLTIGRGGPCGPGFILMREAAHVLRWEGIGTLEPGHHADLCVVDRNPLECPTEDLPGTEVLATLLAGEPVHGQL